ncbi:FHA domain-containing protein [Conyzicola sp.]|uniref:FHA domain-containing protein n=1 Tax=Conyzicola sp. TaxID=1969404 RepID=UPI00398A30C1
MSPDNDSFIAMPPPGAPVEIETTDATSAAAADETEFISLPPGIALDSGTFKVPARTPPSREPAPDIVFVPTVIGATPELPDPDPVAQPNPVAEPTPVAEPVEAPAPPTSPVAVATPAPVWRLALPDGGATIALDAAVLVGRNPAASAAWPQATPVSVDDLTKSVSKTHALLEIDGGVLWVHDLDSTNGVYVVVGDDVVEVVPGTRAAVPAGAELELGEFVTRVTFE